MRENKKIKIFINDEKYEVPKPEMTGLEIKQLGNIPTQNKLYKEEPGKHPDTLIPDSMLVKLKSGDKFYDLPPGTVG